MRSPRALRYLSPVVLRRVVPGLWVCVFAALAVRHWLWMPLLIRGTSMMPTLHNGQVVGLNKMAYSIQPPRRGDVVAVWTGSQYLAKRIVGLPCEQISVHDGEVYINAMKLAEPYVKLTRAPSEIGAGLIERNWFVVAGDNRGPESSIAVVNRERIVGRITSP